MAERRTLGDAMTPEKIAFIKDSPGKPGKTSQAEKPQAPAKTIELSERATTGEPDAGSSRRRSRGRTREALPEASEILDQVLVPITMRLQHRTAQALKRAYLEQKLKHAKPDTLQEIGEEALVDWLLKAGYID